MPTTREIPDPPQVRWKGSTPPEYLRSRAWYQMTYDLAATLANEGIERNEPRLLNTAAGHAALVALAAEAALRWSASLPSRDGWRFLYARKGPIQLRDLGFEGFLQETAKPCARVLWAGMLVERRMRQVKDELPAVVVGHEKTSIDKHHPAQLLEGLLDRKLSYRARYNLACFLATPGLRSTDHPDLGDLDPRDAALQQLALAFEPLYGHLRDRMALQAWTDPSLKSLCEEREADFGAVVGLRPSKPPAAHSESLAAVTAIGPEAAERLAKQGIHSAEMLVNRTIEGVQELAEKLKLSEPAVQRLVDVARLLSLPGLGVTDVNLLVASGVSSPGQLVRHTPVSLTQLLRDTNTLHEIGHRLPSEKTVAEWIEAARHEISVRNQEILKRRAREKPPPPLA